MKPMPLALCLVLLAAAPVVAQTEIAFSAGAGAAAAFPVAEFADGDEVETGFGFTVTGRAHFTPMLALYGEYARFSFGVDTEDLGFDADITDNGFALGGELTIPTAGQLTPLLRVGGIYNQAELQASEGSTGFNVESDRSLGFEVGAGLAFEVGDGLFLVPMVRYRTFSPEFTLFGETDSGDMSYATAGASVFYHFGS